MTNLDYHLAVHHFANWDVPALIRSRAEVRASHPFLVWEPFEGVGQTWTYAEFEHATKQLAAGLAARGVKLGDRVLIHLDNCPETILAWYACAQLGAVAVTTNARSVADDLTYFSEHCAAAGAITQPMFADLVRSACKNIKWLAITESDNGQAPAEGTAPAAADSFERL